MLMSAVKFYYDIFLSPQISLSLQVSPSDGHRAAPPGESLLQAALSQHPGLSGRHRRHHPLPHQQLLPAPLPGRGEVRRDGQRAETAGPEAAQPTQVVGAGVRAGGRPGHPGSGPGLS